MYIYIYYNYYRDSDTQLTFIVCVSIYIYIYYPQIYWPLSKTYVNINRCTYTCVYVLSMEHMCLTLTIIMHRDAYI